MEYHEQNDNFFFLFHIAVLRKKQATQWVRLLPALAVYMFIVDVCAFMCMLALQC